MAKTIEQLKAQGAEVKNATVVGENTATRVGTLFNDIVEHVEDFEEKQEQNDENLNKAIVAETARAKAAEEANTQAIVKQGIYDVSANNDGAVFESLSALLNNADLSTLIPTSVRCGGMSIRFIQGSVPNSDNKYVQYRYMRDYTVTATFTNVANWQGVDDEPTAGSNNLVKSGGIFNRIQKLEYVDVLQNLFNKEKVILNNYYLGGQPTPKLSSNTNFGCQLVEIPNDSSKYIMNYKDYQVDAYDVNKQLISEVYFSARVAHSVPQGTKYLSVSLQKAHIGSYMLVEGETLPESYTEFGTNLKNGTYISKPKTYHVGIRITSDDYYEYQNLTELLKSLKDEDSEKIIYVHGGTYDIFQEYGGADYISTLTGNENWRDVSVFVPNNTKIIGLGKVVLSFAPTDAQIVNSHNAQLFSPLNITGNCHIENIEIEGKNCRYCIHDEVTAGVSENSRHIFKNVKMTKLQGIDGNPQAFGCGFGDGMYYEFDGCDICSYTTAFSMHNTDTTISRKRSVIIIKNCHIHSSGVTDTPIVFRNSSTIQVEHLVNIYNTYIKGSENYVILKIENPSGNVNAVNCFNVSLFGCNQITPSIVGISTENLYEVKQYNNAGWVFYNKKLVFNNDGSVTWVAN